MVRRERFEGDQKERKPVKDDPQDSGAIHGSQSNNDNGESEAVIQEGLRGLLELREEAHTGETA